MEETKTMNVPNEQAFTLSKIKLLKNGGIDIHYELNESSGDSVYNTKHHVESAKDVHPDLRNLLTMLRPIMGKIFNVTEFLDMVQNPEFNATPEQVEKARGLAFECLSHINPLGVSVSGQGDNVGVIITGQYITDSGQDTNINTPRIKLSVDVYGVEKELEAILIQIESEAYEFLFKGKRAQMELFGADATEEDE